MADYALFLKCDGNSKKGNFEENKKPRRPESRYWDEVKVVAGVITGQNRRSNSDARKIELVAPKTGTADRVYFAVATSPAGATLINMSFMCGIHLGVKGNKATVASPFREGGEIQAHLPNSTTFTNVKSWDGVDFQAIGPYLVVRDPNANDEDCVFHKLTIVATVRSTTGVNREFSYDPDLDIELGL